MHVAEQQQPESQVPSQGCAKYAMGHLQVSFSFRVELPPVLMPCVWCLLWCLLSVSGSHLAAMFTYRVQQLGIATQQPFRVYPWQAYMSPGNGLWPMPGVH